MEQMRNPIFGVGGAMNDLTHGAAMNQMLQMQNQVMPQMLQQELLKNQLANQLSQVQANYADPMAQQALALAKLQPAHLQAETGLLGAQTGLTSAQTQMLPMKTQAEMLAAQARMGQMQAAQSNSFRQWMQTPEGQKWAMNPDHPENAAAALDAMKRSAALTSNYQYQPTQVGQQQQAQQPASQGIMPNVGQTFAQNAMQPPAQAANQPMVMPSQTTPFMQQMQQMPQVLNQRLQEAQALQQGAQPQTITQQAQQQAQQQPAIQSANDEIKSIQDGAADSYAKKNLPADIQKRLYAGNRFVTTAPQVLQNFDAASPYFSLGGQAKLQADEKLYASRGIVTPQLQAYRQLQQGIEQLSLQGAFLEGVPADQISRGQYNKVFDLKAAFNNPEGARQLLNSAINYGVMADEANREPLSSVLKSSPEKITSLKEQLSKSPTMQAAQPSGALAAPKGMVAVKTPDGQVWHIPEGKLDAAIKRGAKQVG